MRWYSFEQLKGKSGMENLCDDFFLKKKIRLGKGEMKRNTT